MSTHTPAPPPVGAQPPPVGAQPPAAGAEADATAAAWTRPGFWLRRRGRAALREAGVYAATLGLAALVTFLQVTFQNQGRVEWPPIVLVVAVGGVALAVRRRQPLVAATVPLTLVAWESATVLLLVVCYGAGYRVRTRGHLYAWLGGFAATAVTAVTVSVARGTLDPWPAGAGAWVWLTLPITVLLGAGAWIWVRLAVMVLLAVLAGQVRAQRQALHAAWRERAERADRDRAVAAEQARLRERARITQDMHDALGHRLTMISLQAASLEMDPELDGPRRETAQRLGAAARTALDELRAVIDTPRAAREAAGTLPRRDVDELIEQARGAGMRISLVREGEEEPLSTLTQHALYRVVQESLTNAGKHAPGSPVTVTLRFESGALIAEVRNQRRSEEVPAGPGGGQGLIGLRERVHAVGGLLRAGPDGEEYRVTAILPCQAALAGDEDEGEGDPVVPRADLERLGADASGGAGGRRRAVGGSWVARLAVGCVVVLFVVSAVIGGVVFD